jgi:hypothetical protein
MKRIKESNEECEMNKRLEHVNDIMSMRATILLISDDPFKAPH